MPALAMIAGAARGIARWSASYAVLVRVQLLRVPRHQQQAVVRARAEHQDGEQRRRDARDRHAGVGEDLDHAARDHVGDADDHERDQREQRRAVDHEQQDQDEQGRHEQQGDVGRLERVPQVGLQRRRAGHLGDEPRAAVGDLARLLGERVDVLLGRGVDRDDRERRRAVLGHEALGRVGAERRDGRKHALEVADLLRLVGDRLLVGVGQPAFALIHDDRRGRLAAGEALFDDLVGDDRRGVVGQEARDPVLGDVGQRAGQSGQHHQHHPEADDVPLGPAPARPPGHRLHSVFTLSLPRACAALR